MKIAITGNIGSGKSEVIKFLSLKGYKCISSDQIIKSLYQDKNLREYILNRNILKLVDSAKGIIDIVYNPKLTTLLKRARKNNIPYVGGLTMLIEQAKPSFEKWTNAKIKIDDQIYDLARSKLK